MKPPVIRKFRDACPGRRRERGITMILVAVAMTAIIAMAALSIDVITLYLAREEAQRSADAAALAAARVISVSGITGAADPDTDSSSWKLICGGSSSTATQAALAVVKQNTVGGAAIAGTSTITYLAGSGGTISSSTDCSTLSTAFAVNPIVTVQIQQTGLPTFFSRIWRRTTNTVSATATAEVFNPSDSGNVGNQTTGSIIPVQPRCVKPWMVPNLDPLNPSSACTNNCNPFVGASDGHIVNPGISVGGGNANGVIGERFLLVPDCLHHVAGYCSLRSTQIQANYGPNGGSIPNTPASNLGFLPGQTQYASVAVPSAVSGGSLYEQAIGGCDRTTIYQCGVSSATASSPNVIDLSIGNPDSDTTDGVMALIHEGNANPNGGQPTGQDFFTVTSTVYGYPSAYPFQIYPGTNNPLGLAGTIPVTASNSIASLPIFDPPSTTINATGTTAVTIVGFLQVFINGVDQYGNIDVVVLNVAGCGNGTSTTSSSPVTGSSPVPIRLITSP
jgi:hypothetical protein